MNFTEGDQFFLVLRQGIKELTFGLLVKEKLHNIINNVLSNILIQSFTRLFFKLPLWMRYSVQFEFQRNTGHILPLNNYSLFICDSSLIGHPVYLTYKICQPGWRPHIEMQSPTSMHVYDTDQNIWQPAGNSIGQISATVQWSWVWREKILTQTQRLKHFVGRPFLQYLKTRGGFI